LLEEVVVAAVADVVEEEDAEGEDVEGAEIHGLRHPAILFPLKGPISMSRTEEPSKAGLEGQSSSGAFGMLSVLSIGLCTIVEVVTLASRHWLSRMMNDFAVEMSVVTRFSTGPLFPTLLAIVILTGICMQFLLSRQSARDKWNLMILMFGVASLAVYMIGVLVPLMSLVKSLS